MWREPAEGIEIFVETNGIHTGIVVPLQNKVHDWTDIIRPEHIKAPLYGPTHVQIGWGHAGVYRNAQHWKDLRVQDAVSAIVGSNEVLLHVSYLRRPAANSYRRSLRVDDETYRKIISRIQAKFVLNNYGQPSPSAGYGEYDLFYEARGKYHAFNTCNNWTSEVLRNAGVRVGIWTPFQGGVMRWFPAKSERP